MTRGARNQALSQGYNSSFVGLADSEASWGDSTATVVNSLYTTETNVVGKNTISGGNLKYRFPRYNNINITARDEYPATGVGANIFSYGNYYSWPAVIADTTNRTSGIYATTSICPINWQIPIGSSSGDGDYYPLNSLITPSYSSGSAGFRKYPTNYIYSGYIYGNTISSRGTAGGCWTTNSSTGGDYAFDLYFTKTNVYPGTLNDYKYTGFSVRCRLIED